MRALGAMLSRWSISLMMTHNAISRASCAVFAYGSGDFFVGFLRCFLRLAIHHLAHQDGLGGQLAIHGCFALQLAEVAAPGDHRNLNAELVTRNHWPAESRVVNSDKIKQLLYFVAIDDARFR